MRIAISGSHGTGKSSIAHAFAESRTAYHVVDEPYHVMVSEGALFSTRPTAEDFEAQLERSAALLEEHSGREVLFDRCPIDFFAYLTALPEYGQDSLRHWFPRVQEAMRSIDLVAYVPIEHPDRVELTSHELLKLRRVVDHQLRSFLVNDDLGLGMRVLELRGSVPERTRQLVECVDRLLAGAA